MHQRVWVCPVTDGLLLLFQTLTLSFSVVVSFGLTHPPWLLVVVRAPSGACVYCCLASVSMPQAATSSPAYECVGEWQGSTYPEDFGESYFSFCTAISKFTCTPLYILAQRLKNIKHYFGNLTGSGQRKSNRGSTCSPTFSASIQEQEITKKLLFFYFCYFLLSKK